MKRFFEAVTVSEAMPETGGWGVLLDDKPVMTPAKAAQLLPGRELADAIAGEWRDQGDDIDPSSMGLNRLANTAIDCTASGLDEVRAEVVRYAETDLVCYRVAGPADLRGRQDAAWDPVVKWGAQRYGLDFAITDAIAPVVQPEAVMQAARSALEPLDPFVLTGTHALVAATGSFALGLAGADREIDAETTWAASLIEETYQIEKWGEDEDARIRRAALRRDVDTACRFVGLCQT